MLSGAFVFGCVFWMIAGRFALYCFLALVVSCGVVIIYVSRYFDVGSSGAFGFWWLWVLGCVDFDFRGDCVLVGLFGILVLLSVDSVDGQFGGASLMFLVVCGLWVLALTGLWLLWLVRCGMCF